MKKIRRRQTMKMITVSAIMILLSTGLISSGAGLQQNQNSFQQNSELLEDEKKLTTKDMGLLILSGLFMKDKQQRQFVFTVIQELQKSGELTQREIQSVTDRLFTDPPRVFLFADISFNNWGIVCPFPGLISSFILRKPSFSLLICENGYFTRGSTYHGLSDILIIGFYGEIINSPTERDSSVWQYHVDGTCVLALIKDD